MWPWTSAWWNSFCSTPRSAASSGSTASVSPWASISSRPRRASFAVTTRLSSPNTRSGATRSMPFTCSALAAAVAGSSSSPSSTTRRTARSVRSGSSAKAVSETIRTTRASRSARPPCGSSSSPPASGSAIALIVKSRAARSASMSPCSVTRSTCQPWSGPTTRQAPNAPDSSNATPPRRARDRPRGLARVAVERDVQVVRGAAEQPVAHGAAYEPRLTARERLARGLERLRRRAPRLVAAPPASSPPVTGCAPSAPAARDHR